ncbi:AfsR/SARP family transcriptional regulator, partial [Nonomuraea longicatena]|uniref:ATP-binding protein n=1 Tax=Nonomuraea longicatena TaxID=83682 RepID=UPI0031D3B03F
DALALVERARRTLADHLGVDRGPDLRAAHLAVLKGEHPVRPAAPTGAPRPGALRPGAPDLHPVRPAAPTGVPDLGRTPAPVAEPGGGQARKGAARGGNVRAPLTGFVGRDAELADLLTLLGTTRLATIVGPGGAGKTRLATEAALRENARLPGGAWLVELAPVTDPADVPGVLLSTLGLRTDHRALGLPGESPEARIAEHLGGAPALIVLDNCEHLVAAAAALSERVLATAPGLRVLATSREPLNVPGERLVPLPPLLLPPEGVDAAAATAYPSVRLLIDRATAVRPSFRLDAGNVAAVSAICRRLDGMPLAIELAAARLRTMTAGRLAERIDDRFRLLTGGSRTALPRQQTLRAVVEWSWDLLTAEEQRLAARFAVFAGGATLETVEAVCDGDPGVLGALADKSLVQMGDDGRYRMLETIRAFALERLAEAGEEIALRRRLAVHLRDLAEAAVPWLRRAEQLEWQARIAAERDNFSQALHFAIDRRDVELSVRLCGALVWYWVLFGSREEPTQWTAQVVALVGDKPPDGLAGAYAGVWFTHQAMRLGRITTDLTQVTRKLDELVESALAEGPIHPMLPIGQAVLALMCGRVEYAEALLDRLAGDDDVWLASSALMLAERGRSEDKLERAAAGFRSVGDRWGLSEALLSLAAVRAADGRPVADLLAEIREVAGAWGDPNDSIVTLSRVAVVRAQTGDLDGAAADLDRAGAALNDGVPVETLAHFKVAEGLIRYYHGEFAASLAAYRMAMEVFSDTVPDLLGSVRTHYGRALVAAGDLAGGLAQHRIALADERTVPHGFPLSGVFSGFALAALEGGDTERAALLFGAATSGDDADLAVDTLAGVARVRTALGAARYADLHARGAAMSEEELRDLARTTGEDQRTRLS